MSGDITATCRRLEGEDLVLSFIDTDNYTPARAALDVARDRTVPGGAIVFDHFTGTSRFRYTLGERIAGRVLVMCPAWRQYERPLGRTRDRHAADSAADALSLRYGGIDPAPSQISARPVFSSRGPGGLACTKVSRFTDRRRLVAPPGW
jgi:hypothetical protein